MILIDHAAGRPAFCCLGRPSFWVLSIHSEKNPVIYLPYLASPAPEGEATPPIVLGSPDQLPERRPLRHLLIGHPADIRHAIHQLHTLSYAEQFRWTQLLAVPPGGILLTQQQGAAISYLIRWQFDGSDRTP